MGYINNDHSDTFSPPDQSNNDIRYSEEDTRSELTLKTIQEQCFRTANDLGWNETFVPVPEMIALIHSEASEALEAYRKDEKISWTDDKGKPQGIASEFADIAIRVMHYASLLKIDLQKEVLRKLEYNKTRPYRHGGLKA